MNTHYIEFPCVPGGQMTRREAGSLAAARLLAKKLTGDRKDLRYRDVSIYLASGQFVESAGPAR